MTLSRFARVLRFVGAAILVASALHAYAQSATVLVILSEAEQPYTELATLLKTALEAESKGAVAVQTQLERDNPATRPAADVVVTIGVTAFQKALLHPDAAPIVATLIPRQSFERLVPSPSRANATAVLLDQPVPRQLALARAALPKASTLSLLVSPQSRVDVAGARQAAKDLGFALNVEPVSDEEALFASLQRALNDSDALLALPDPVVINRASIYNLLLTTYRSRVPVLGYSEQFVRAGTLAAVYSTPAQIASQTIDAVRRALLGQPLPAPRAPDRFAVTVNRSVARSLGIALPEDAELAARVQALEKETQ